MNKHRTAVKKAVKFNRKPLITALESRILLDGAAVATGAEALTDVAYQFDSSDAADNTDVKSLAPTQVRAADPTQNNGRREVAFIDTSVSDYQVLVDGISAGVEVQLIDGSQDGLAQLLTWSQQNSGYDAIHLLSHGDEGELRLGSLTLNSLNASARSAELNALGAALTEEGDLLLYGCDVASGEGQHFVALMARLTGADIAASDDLTGATVLGGDWVLEVQTGTIDKTGFWELDPDSYQHILAVDQNFDGEAVGQSGSSSQTYGSFTFTGDGGANIAIIGSESNIASGTDHAVRFDSVYQTNVNTISFATTDGSEFALNSLAIDSGLGDTAITITGKRDSITVEMATIDLASSSSNGGASYIGTWYGTITFSGWDNVDEIVITGSGTNGLDIDIDDIDIGAAIQPNAAPEFTGALSDSTESISLDENSANGTTVFDVDANDGDGGASDSGIAYSIVSGNTDGDKDGNLPFAINPSTGVITLNDTGDLDYEDGATAYNLTVRADDGGFSNNTSEATVTVNIQNVGAGDSYDYETIASNETTFSSSGQAFTLTGLMRGQNFSTYGSSLVGENGNSDHYIDSNINGDQGNVGGIRAPAGYTFRAQMFDVWPSSNKGGAVMTPGQTITVIGNLNGSQVVSAEVTTFSYGQDPIATGGAWQRIDLTGTDFLTADIDTVEFVLSGSMNYLAVDNFVYDNLTVSNANPTLTTIGNVTGGTEDSEQEISFADLQGLADEADSDGTVNAFVIKAISTGALKIGADAASATAWAAGSNDLIDATHKAFWTPAPDSNSNLNAFTVAAQDDGGAESATPVQVVVEVASVNDAPTLNNSTALTAIDEDVPSADVEDVSDYDNPPPNWGDDIQVLLTDSGFNDVDGDAPLGIVIVADASDPVTEGKWQYSTDEDTQYWHDIGAVSATEGLLLAYGAGDNQGHTTYIRFVPVADFSGTPGALTIHAVDGSANDIQNWTFTSWDGTTENRRTFDTTADGPTSAVSANSAIWSVTVNPVNDAPVLDNDPSPALSAINEDVADADNSGNTVAEILADGAITDPDGAAVEAIAVSAVDISNGTWQYKVGSGEWTAFDFSENHSDTALLLDSTDSIRFLPAADFNGTVTAGITFHAWDKTNGTAGQYFPVSGFTGGSGPLSAATDTASITVNPVNDAPSFGGDTLGGTVSFTEGGIPVVLDADVQIFDAELDGGTYAGATLTLERNGSANAEDLFSASGTLGALVEGGDLIVGGTVIGTVTTHSAGTLKLTFNTGATQVLVNAAMRQIAYGNSTDAPPASIQIDWTLSDGNAGSQGTGGALSASGFTMVNVVDGTAPELDNTTPADGAAAVAPSTNLQLVFNENITAGSGNITLIDVSNGGTTVETFNIANGIGDNGGTVAVSGATLTINPSSDLAEATQYAVQIDATAIEDTAGNAFAGISDTTTYNFTTGVTDGTAPTLLAVQRGTPSGEATNADTLSYTVKFSEAVTGVDAGDFALDATGNASGSITGISGNGTDTIIVTVGGVSGTGNLGINLNNDHGITDLAGNALPDAETIDDERYQVDRQAPTLISLNRLTSGDGITNANTVQFLAVFSEPVSGLDAGDFSVNGTGTITAVSGNGTPAITITVGNVSGDGSLDLDLVGSPTIVDSTGNGLTNISPTSGVDESYVIDNSAPTAVSITRADNEHTSADSVTFNVVFSEAVENLDASDFELTGAASGTIASVSGTGNSYTVTVTGVSGDGELNLNFVGGQNITDMAGNNFAGNEPATDESYSIDNSAPTVAAINRAGVNQIAAGTSTDAVFTVVFDEPVSGLATTDFTVTGTATNSGVTAVSSADGKVFQVTVGNVNGTIGQTVGLEFTGSVSDALNQTGSASFTGGQEYTIGGVLLNEGAVTQAELDSLIGVNREGTLLKQSVENTRQVVIVDSRVPGLVDLVAENNANADIWLLDGSRSAIEQISEILANYANLEALHIFSHGSVGEIHLGAETISPQSLQNSPETYQAWGNALSESGDILLYGCNVAQGETGQAFIQSLANITNADIAATDDLTGSKFLGGDWVLEYETSLNLVSPIALETYAETLLDNGRGGSSDTTAPSFDSTPSASNVSTTTLDLMADINEAGTIYYLVVTDGATVPTSSEIINGSYGSTVVASGSQAVSSGNFSHTFNVSGLSAATAYDIYVVAHDDEGTPNVMASPTKVDVTTSESRSLLFGADDANGHRNLWGYNPDTGNVVPVSLSNPEGAGGPPRYDIFNFNGKLYSTFFTADGEAKIGAFNGTEVDFIGTVSASNFDPELNGFTEYQGDLYFTMEPDGSNRAIIKYDPVSDTLTNITSGLFEAGTQSLIVFDDGSGSKLYFDAEPNDGDLTTLYRWDGTSIESAPGFSGTDEIADMAVFNGAIYFSSTPIGKYDYKNGESTNTYDDNRLYKYDGASVTQIKDFNSDLGDPDPYIQEFTVFNGKLFFSAWTLNSSNKDSHLYSIDTGGNITIEYDHSSNNGPSNLVVHKNQLYFTVDAAGSSGDDFDIYRYNSTNNVTNLTSGVASFTGNSRIMNLMSYKDGIIYQQDTGDGDEMQYFNLLTNTVTQLTNINNDPSSSDGDSLQNNSADSPFVVYEGNIAPLVNAMGRTSIIPMDAGPTIINPDIEVFEIDNNVVKFTQVSFTSGFQSGDTLAVTEMHGITASYNASTGVLSLTGEANPSQYQAILRTLTFDPVAVVGDRALLFQATDIRDKVSTAITESAKYYLKVVNGVITTFDYDSQPTGVPSDTDGTYVGSFSFSDATLGSVEVKVTEDGLSTDFDSLTESYDANSFGIQYSSSRSALEVQINGDTYQSPDYLAIRFDNPSYFYGFKANDYENYSFDAFTVTGFKNGVQVAQETFSTSNYGLGVDIQTTDSGFESVDEIRINPDISYDSSYTGFGTYFDDIVFVTPGNPTLSTSLVGSPAAADTSVQYTVTFSDAVTGVSTDDFALTTTGTASGTIASVSGSGATYTVTVNDLSGAGTVRLDLNGSTDIQDSNNNAPLAYTSGASHTVDLVAPTFDGAASSPADNDGFGTALTANIDLSFSENIALGTGNIVLKDLTNGITVETFNAANPGSSLSVSGSTLTINPSSDLVGGTDYAIQIDATAVDDTAGNSFAGIGDDATYNFTTPPLVELSVDSNSVAEADGTATYTLTLKDSAGNAVNAISDVTVNLSFGGTASGSGTDYSLGGNISGNSVTIATGQSFNTFTVTPVDDGQGDADETVIVSVDSVVSGLKGTAQQLTVTFTENQAPSSSHDSVSLNGSDPLVLATTDFGDFTDTDGDSLAAIKIAALAQPANAGTLEYDTSGSGNWTAVTVNQEISSADIAAGRLRYSPSSGDQATLQFRVGDGTDFSTSAYTLMIGPGNTGSVESAVKTGTMIHVETDGGLGLSTLTAEPSPTSGLPRSVRMPVGMVGFTITGLENAGDTANVTLSLDASAGVKGYYKQNLDTGKWESVASVTTVGGKTMLSFSLTDGGVYDADREANGVIVDPGVLLFDSLAPEVNENTTYVTDLSSALDLSSLHGTVTYALTGAAADNGLFSVDAATGVVRFNGAPDYENPTDAGGTVGDNIYLIQVTASGSGGGSIVQDLQVAVVDDIGANGQVLDLQGDSTELSADSADYLDAYNPNLVDVVGLNSGEVFNNGYLVISQIEGTKNGSFSFDTAAAESGGDATIAASETVAVGGKDVGTVDGILDGQDGRDLRINFYDDQILDSHVEGIITNLMYQIPGQVDGERVFSLVLNDGTNDYEAVTFSVTGATVSAPVVSGIGDDSGSSASDGITRDNTLVLNGTATGNASIVLYRDGSEIGTTTADGNGNWSFDYTATTLTDGHYLFTAKTSDGAGNISGTSSAFAVTVDTNAPTTTIASAALSNDTGASDSDFITGNTSQTISGTLSTNLASDETVYVSLDNGATWTAATATEGSDTWSLAGQTLTGSDTLKVKVTDAAGNDGEIYSQAYVLDTAGPQLSSSTPVDGVTGISVGDNIVLTFDEDIALGGSGSIILYDITGAGANSVSIDVASHSDQLSVSGNTLTIDPSANLQTTNQYAVQFTAGAVQDTHGNNIAAVSDTTTLNFTTGTVDTTAPTVVIVDVADPTKPNTGTVVINFSEAVTNVDIGDFNLTRDSNAVNISGLTVDGSGSQYSLDLSSVTTDAGIYVLTINTSNIQDSSGNALAAGASETFVIDTSAPTGVAITRASSNPSGADSLSFTVAFSEAVSGVDSGDFTLTGSAAPGATINSSVTRVSDSVYKMTVDNVSGDGTLGLDLKASDTGITDTAGNALSGGATGQLYTLDNTSPNATSITRNGGTITNGGTLSYTVSFNEAVTGVDAGDFTLDVSDSVTVANGDGDISITGSGSIYTLTVSNVSGNGTLGIDLKVSGTGITDASGNAIGGGFTNGDSYILDTIDPTVTASQSFDIPENMAAGFVIGQVKASDANGITSYSIASGNDAGYFAIDSDGVITLTAAGAAANAASADYETGANSFDLGIIATDAVGNASASQTVTVTVLDENSTPAVTAGGSTAFTEQTPVVVASDITISDEDGDANWNGGTLAVQITANSSGEDSLILLTSNPGGNGIWLDTSGNKLMSGTTQIGSASATTVTDGTAWTFTFNNNATNALVQATAQAVQFANNSNAPSVAGRTLTFTATDMHGASASTTQTVTVTAVNDAPVATADTGHAVEASGVSNSTAGSNATGNLLSNDSDVDNGDTREVSGIAFGSTVGTLGTPLAGSYGSLTLKADGSYEYVIDEVNAAVQALRLTGQTLQESFTYTVTDAGGLTDQATLTVTIDGRNDTPVALDDSVTAVEAGGVADATPGTAGTGNALDNDGDVDANSNGETKTMTAVRTGAESGTGTAGTIGQALTGTYGSLILKADGSYSYVIDESNAAVQALRLTGQTLQESFTYTVTDAGGLTDQATLTVTIDGRNDTPVALDDSVTAVEAGGVANATPGSDGTGNVLSNDTDADSVANGETKTVTAIRTGTESDIGTAGTIGQALVGTYGSLTLNSDGSYNYVINESNAAVQALRISGQQLQESFTYTVIDAGGLTDQATLTVTIDGRNDNPVAVDDSVIAIEAGGVANATAGSDGTGNVLSNDSDVDASAKGETKTVTVLRTGAEADSGTAGMIGQALVGTYGSLTLNADGSYSYVIDESNAEVQALRTSGQTLQDRFTYTVTDTGGLTDRATLTVMIDGRNDNPVALDDSVTAVEASGVANATTGSNGTGNVLDNDSDVDGTANGEIKTVTAMRTGAESETGTAGAIGQALAGTYGTLTLKADGNYEYVIDESNAAVQALRISGQQLQESFTYTVTDAGGLTDQATLTVTIDGRNDNPVALDDSVIAIEAGGVANGMAGSAGSGNVLSNDTDVDGVANGESKTVTALRTGAESDSGMAGTIGQALAGTYGSLTLKADGSYGYVIDESNAEVQALRTSGQTLQEQFTYTVTDAGGLTDRATLTVTIDGRNDNPVAVDDSAIAIEAGGVANAKPGSDGTGNVLSNDSDVDANSNGDTKTVTAMRTGAESGTGTAGAIGQALAGTYGSLTLKSDGSYEYVIDESNTAVQALRLSGQTLQDQFTYTVSDQGGLTDQATLTVTIDARNDTPVAVDDSVTAIEAGDVANGTAGSDGTGNVLSNDSDVDSGDTKTVTALRTGAETDNGTAGTIGQTLAGTYGTLTLNADGSYRYVIDETNAAVQALRISGQTLQDQFTYTVSDAAGLTDKATLTVSIDGRNDTPAVHDTNIDEKWSVGKGYQRDISVLFSDVDSSAHGEDLDFVIDGLPAGLSYDDETGLIFGKPAESGKFVVNLTAIDVEGASMSRQYLLEIVAPPQETPATVTSRPAIAPQPPAVDSSSVQIELSGLPDGLINQGGSRDSFDSSGYMAPRSGESSSSSQASNETATSTNQSGSDTETVLLADERASVVRNTTVDGNTTVTASVEVNVSGNGEVVFSDTQQRALDVIALKVTQIHNRDGIIDIAIADTKAGIGQQYSATMADGTALPAWIKIDPNTGNVNVNPPVDAKEVAIRIRAMDSDGQVRILEIKLDLEDLATSETSQNAAVEPLMKLADWGFVPLADQLAAEADAIDGYGERLVAMLATA